MKQQVKLQKATEDDAIEVVKMEKAVESRIFHANTKDTPAIEFISKNEVFFIIFENQNVGVVAYRPEETGYYIADLIILPQYQRKGIGFKAMGLILEKIGSEQIFLRTHPDNAPALGLYQKLGFKITSRIENCYGDGEPRLILTRS